MLALFPTLKTLFLSKLIAQSYGSPHAPSHLLQAVYLFIVIHLSSPLNHIRAYTHLCISVWVNLCTNAHLCMCIYTNEHLCVCTCNHVCPIRTYVHLCTYVWWMDVGVFFFFLICSYLFIYLFWLHWVLVATCRLLSWGIHAGSSSPTRDRTRAPCIGSTESYPLDHQGSSSTT